MLKEIKGYLSRCEDNKMDFSKFKNNKQKIKNKKRTKK